MIAFTTDRGPLYGPAASSGSERPTGPEPGSSGCGLRGLDVSAEARSGWISTVARERAPKWGEPRRGAGAEPPCGGPIEPARDVPAEAPPDPFGDQDALL